MSRVKKKKEDNDIQDLNFDYMKSIKNNINNVLLNKSLLPKINDVVDRTNKIVVHTYQFLKLYLINLFDTNKQFPKINRQFIEDIFKVVSFSPLRKTDKLTPQQLNIHQFFDTNYTIDVLPIYTNLTSILAYEAIDIVTNINTNIQEHYIPHLFKYINLYFDVKNKKDEITSNTKDKILRKQLHSNLNTEIKKVKNDIISFKPLTSDPKYHFFILETRKNLYRNLNTKSSITKTKFKNNNIFYDLKSETEDYLYSMFYLCSELEKLNTIRKENGIKQTRLFNVLPLRTNIINKHITIDTCGLLFTFLSGVGIKQKIKTYKEGDNQINYWRQIFNLDDKSFNKKSYLFNYIIKTDGVSISILFIKVDEDNIPLNKTFTDCSFDTSINYIENTEITNRLKQKRIVCADPNMSNLIYCGSKNESGGLETFRYTQNQRRVETKKKKYSKLIDKLNKSTKINNQTIKQIETELSLLNSKSIKREKFNTYIIKKNEVNNKLSEYYNQRIFKKLKLNSYINTQKSESKMIKNFGKKFGVPSETIFIIGDYDKGGYNMKGKEPAICKKFRRIFKYAGYETFLINEFRTSMLCSCCHSELSNFLVRPSKKPKLLKENKTELVHGLLRCQSVTPECKIIHNRDKNAVQNMLYIVESVYNTGKRPTIFSRTVEDPLIPDSMSWI